MNGILTNQRSCFKYLSKNQQSINRKISTILFKTKKKSDLIVILDSSTNANALNEGYLTRTPVISLNSDNSDIKSSYTVPGNFKFANKKVRNNFFYSVLSATLKKARISHELQKHKRNITKKPFVTFKKYLKNKS
jgi:ribosomal protein S2